MVATIYPEVAMTGEPSHKGYKNGRNCMAATLYPEVTTKL
jgi:hypothetical protein